MPDGTAVGRSPRRFRIGAGTMRCLAQLGCDRMDERNAHRRLPRWENDDGQTMVEYGFVMVAVALVAIAAYQAFGGRVGAMINTVVW